MKEDIHVVIGEYGQIVQFKEIEVSFSGEEGDGFRRVNLSFSDKTWFRLVHHKVGDTFELQILSPALTQKDLDNIKSQKEEWGWTEKDFEAQAKRLETLYECPPSKERTP